MRITILLAILASLFTAARPGRRDDTSCWDRRSTDRSCYEIRRDIAERR